MHFHIRSKALVSYLGLLVAFSSNAQQTNLSVDKFQKAIAQTNIQLVDVRTQAEYNSGHLSHAMLADWNDEREFKSRVLSLDKNRPVYTYCFSGARSNEATQWLRQNGFIAFNLKGGISAWKRADKPVEQPRAVKQITMEQYLSQVPKDKTVLVDFGAVWCPPCKKMALVIDSLVKKYGSRFVLVNVDGGEQTNICNELKVDAFPTFIIYKKGKEAWRKQGLTEIKEFAANF
ncbi:MAG TPA: thioredoxin domain-containing protein [Puia sp.]|nr:thioredoxin domain-containing protein [Puia sp.]